MSGFLKEFFSTNLYKSAQGRTARRLTFVGLALVFVLWAYSIWRVGAFGVTGTNIAAVAVLLLGVWGSFRAINYPTFADFLVSVEAEMSKVSWPSKGELFANTKVVMVFMVLFTLLIFLYDVVFRGVFSIFT